MEPQGRFLYLVPGFCPFVPGVSLQNSSNMRQHTKPAWLDAELYPFVSRFFSCGEHQLHYIDEGSGPVLLFVHGTPSWSFDFRQVIAALRKDYRCIAVDHMGFGLSDKPKDYAYTPQQHAANLSQLIRSLRLEAITLVMHDFGGPIGFAAALEQPQRFARLVFMNTWLWNSEGEPGFEKLRKVLRSPLLPVLYRWFNFSARFLLPTVYGPGKRPSKEVLRQYRKPFGKASQREGTIGFARSLLRDQDWFQSLWEQREQFAPLPKLLIWGMSDPMIGAAYLSTFQEAFPDAPTVALEGTGHFPQEESPAEVCQALRQLIE